MLNIISKLAPLPNSNKISFLDSLRLIRPIIKSNPFPEQCRHLVYMTAF